MRGPLLLRRATPAELLSRYRRARARTRALFAIPVEDAYYERPIPLRHPIVFYEGHLPAFAVNTLLKLARGSGGVDPGFERLFERGIDPDDLAHVIDPARPWPSRTSVMDYAAAAEVLVERALLDLGDTDIEAEAANTIIEHELMHQETLLYMFHNLPYRKKRRPQAEMGSAAPSPKGRSAEPCIAIPGGIATLGADDSEFGWDNEFPRHQVEVAAFHIDSDSVTNGHYLEFVQATGASPPHFWTGVEGQWFWRGMFELIPLPLDWPVYVTLDEASSYARWRNGRIPTESEFHRAAFGTPAGQESAIGEGNFDFRRWDPVPVGSSPGGTSAWGVRDLVGNGWEWTSTPFSGFPRFDPMQTYPRYSADFFDGRHFVLKGASPVTPRELVRPSFRNWFRSNYPFVFAKFRCAR